MFFLFCRERHPGRVKKRWPIFHKKMNEWERAREIVFVEWSREAPFISFLYVNYETRRKKT